MSRFFDHLASRVLLADGAMGTQIQSFDLSVEKDFLGCENCSEVLNKSRPDLVRDIHIGYFRAGADAVETNTFGGSVTTLGEFGLQDETFEINKKAAELAHEAKAEFSADGRERFILGSIGPGTKLPSLGHIDYQSLEESFTTQCQGLIAGAVDAFLIETCQDSLQIKAAVNAARRARAEKKVDIPIIVQVTVETTGTLLVGSDIAAAATVVRSLDIPMMGLNCATGPREMAEHIGWLSENWPGLISVVPNAGLPEVVDGAPYYPLTPEELSLWLDRFLTENGVNMIGGCCGTGTAHIEALDRMLSDRSDGGYRPTPVKRQVYWVPGVASLYGQQSYRQENAYFDIGERCNANGSRRWREFQQAADWDACIAMGKEQLLEGAHALDLCTAFVGRDEEKEMVEVVTRMRGALDAPLVFDSTERNVLEKALELYGGKPIINSINFEDGEEPAAQRLALARKFGAGVIALTIDEEGMAKDAERKFAVARRLFDFACNRHGLEPSDLLFDPLTFTICTGNEDDRKLGLWTLEAIETIAREMPDCQIILGLSNISFGINPAARHVLNSVFLDEALKRGLTGAILHSSRIMPLHKIPEDEIKAAQDLIFDRRQADYDPLHVFIDMFSGRTAAKKEVVAPPADVNERLKLRIIDGDKQDLEKDLQEALSTRPPLDIVNDTLLGGMKVVGDLFGAGKMQLPFVLRSAETMKQAVAYLEPHMERLEGSHKGTMVLATVKGDVHDIGKNLVDIILSNNGFKVVNLGIKQPISDILSAVRDHDADAVGLSGLLVKSTVIMRENLEEMTRQGLDMPVILGGAALNRKYVVEECVPAYGAGRVAYARDAFDGLDLMNRVVDGDFDQAVRTQIDKIAERKKASGKRVGREQSQPNQISQASPKTDSSADSALDSATETAPQAAVLTPAAGAESRPVGYAETKTSRVDVRRDEPVPKPPFFGARLIDHVPIKTLLPYLSQTMLFQFHWGFKKAGKSRREYEAWARRELQPILQDLAKRCHNEAIIHPAACYGYWPCAADGDDLIVFAEDCDTQLARFSFPRQVRPHGLCIADFFRSVDNDQRDVIGLQVVTAGERASEVARQWFATDRYQDYLYLHGLSVEIAEALAEYVHARIRREWGFGHEDARDMATMLKQGYRGARYSFGYPACPNLADQTHILRLLEAERIDVKMSEEDQLHPEQSTSAIVVHHPQAGYFTI